MFTVKERTERFSFSWPKIMATLWFNIIFIHDGTYMITEIASVLHHKGLGGTDLQPFIKLIVLQISSVCNTKLADAGSRHLLMLTMKCYCTLTT